MIVLTIEIGVREAFGMLALGEAIKCCGHDCVVVPRFVLPRIAPLISGAVVVIDGAREVRGRRKLLTRLQNNKNVVCLFDTEGFALQEDKLRLRYPHKNLKFIDYILTWGTRTHSRLIEMGYEEKLIEFGNPQFAYFELYKDTFKMEANGGYVLANTAFPAADIISDSVNLPEARIDEAKETRENFIKFLNDKYQKGIVKVRVHPNERPDYYKKIGFDVIDNTRSSSFEDILKSKQVIGVNCTTLVEARIVGKRATNILLEKQRHQDIESICENIDLNGTIVNSSTKTLQNILFTSNSGYNLEKQAETLTKIDKKNYRLSILLRMIIIILSFILTYVHRVEARKYNYSYVKKVRKSLGA